MEHIIESDAQGTLHLPAHLLGEATPHMRYTVLVIGDTMTVRREEELPFWKRATPAERAQAFLDWANSHTGGPGLPDEALHRENMYD